MREAIEDTIDWLYDVPAVAVFVAMAMGIVCADSVVMPVWLWGVVALAIVLCVVILSSTDNGKARIVMAMMAVVALGGMLYSLRQPVIEVPYNERVALRLHMDDYSVATSSHKYNRTSATVLTCEQCKELAGAKIVVWSRSDMAFVPGDELSTTTRIGYLSDTEDGYFSAMRHRGFVGSAFVASVAEVSVAQGLSARLHTWAVEKLRMVVPSGNDRAVILSMAVGERSEVGKVLRDAYAASGTSHLMAVSGLHVGIVFLIINLLLRPLVLLWRGVDWSSLLAIALIWLYVCVCGMPPSAVRAAVMFTALQFAMFSGRSYVGLNILAATAVAMLVVDARLLFDVGFQLSFIAVAAILLWGRVLDRAIVLSCRWLKGIAGLMVIGFVATIATAPIISHAFGRVSIVGILLNPIVVATAYATILFAIIALLSPITLLSEWVATVAEWVVRAQNVVVEWAASLSFGHIEFRLSATWTWVCYLLYILLTMVGWRICRAVEQRQKIGVS